jgi:hypothetical protein
MVIIRDIPTKSNEEQEFVVSKRKGIFGIAPKLYYIKKRTRPNH